MAADTYSALLGVLLMGTGNDNNSWGVNANSGIFQIIEDAIAGVLSNSVTGGTLDLSTPAPPSAASLARYKFLTFSGTLVGSQTVKVPALNKEWVVTNNCSGDIFMQTPTGTQITIPVGTTKHVYCDGTNVTRLDVLDVGKVSMFAGASVPAGHLECTGASLLRASYPELFTKIGTAWGTVDLNHFTLPDMTTLGRFPRSRKTGTDDVGTTYAHQVGTHSHTGTVTVSGTTTAAGTHNHTATSTVTDAGHSHLIYGPSGSVANTGTTGGTGNIEGALAHSSSTAVTGVQVTTTLSTAPDHTHNFSASSAFTTDATGGTETRPNAIVFRFYIKY